MIKVISSEKTVEWFKALSETHIYFNLTGGLGNQLFGLSEAFNLHRIYQKPVYLDVSNIQHAIQKEPEWLNHISAQGWSETVIIEELAEPTVKREKQNLKELSNREIASTKASLFEGWRFNYHRVLESGLFVPNKNPFIEENLDKKDEIALHFRGGDYSNAKGIGILTQDFYQKALKEIGGFNDTIEIYTDDLRTAKETLEPLLKSIPHTYSNEESPIRILNAFSTSKKFIASNSTLSWWGIYFAQNQKTIMPTPFYLQGELRARDIRIPNPSITEVNRYRNQLQQIESFIYWKIQGAVKKLFK
jgi:hypothetical protein